MMSRLLENLRHRGIDPWVGLGYAAVVAVFIAVVAQFYIPGKGLSYLIAFGAKQEAVRLSKIRKLDYYVTKGSDGYDAQYYVQIAMDPSLQNQGLKRAVDSLPYRGRRILFATTAYVMGLGQPEWILQAFALQNAIAWLLLAGLLLHWFPPRSWDNLLRWAGVLFSMGVCLSFRNALFDGPSLLVIAFGVYLLDRGRPWWSTAVLGLSGLGKETNLLGSAALLPPAFRDGRAWGLAMLRGVLTAAPLLLWLVYIAAFVGGRVDDAGARNFDLPFAAYGRKWTEVMASLPELSAAYTAPLWSLLMLIVLTVQFLYLVLRPQWSRAWWRIGISYALLMVFLGDAVWEGYPGAAARVLLPMQLAFNCLVPVGRGWLAVLVLGNIAILAAPAALESPAGDGYVVRGRDELVYGTNRQRLEVEFSDTWHLPEQLGGDYWRWSSGSGTLTVYNPQPGALVARLRFTVTVSTPRRVTLRQHGTVLWSTELGERSTVNVTLGEVVLPPNASSLEFEVEGEPSHIGSDPRPLAMRLQNLRVDVQRRLADEP